MFLIASNVTHFKSIIVTMESLPTWAFPRGGLP
jgi:hypothetical protein